MYPFEFQIYSDAMADIIRVVLRTVVSTGLTLALEYRSFVFYVQCHDRHDVSPIRIVIIYYYCIQCPVGILHGTSICSATLEKKKNNCYRNLNFSEPIRGDNDPAREYVYGVQEATYEKRHDHNFFRSDKNKRVRVVLSRKNIYTDRHARRSEP